MFDGTYVARSLDVASKHSFYDGIQRLVGLKCSEWNEDDLSVAAVEKTTKMLRTTLRRAEEGGEANLFKRIDMAPEVFVIYFQSAVGPRDEPCVPVLTLAKEAHIGVSSNVQAGPSGYDRGGV